MARGERPVGRKIGFTNRTIWAEYGVYAPIWGDMYDTTLRDLAATDGALDLGAAAGAAHRAGDRLRLRGRAASRHERGRDARLRRLGRAWLRDRAVGLSRLAIRTRRTPSPPMRLHGAYRLGQRHTIAAEDRVGWLEQLPQLRDRAQPGRRGHRSRAGAERAGRAALDHQPSAGRAGPGHREPAAGGRRDRHHRHGDPRVSVAPGEVWQTRPIGLPLDGISLRFT